jgi:hypothetical protein
VRWSNLSLEAEESARLPGYKDEAVVRHFEAPDAVPTRFYEVRAKSILNRVPAASQMPFRWTINPYRGCTHACVYCGWGGTPILLANGRHKPLEELDLGDAIYGTERHGKYRRYVATTVLAKWVSVKPAYRVVAEDGTELILSGDHRLLTNRGWKHVMNSGRGTPDRPHLTLCNQLVGTGAFASQPVHNADYRRGYICGMVRGDGTLGSYSYPGTTRGVSNVHQFGLTLADPEALARTGRFLAEAGVHTKERILSQAVGVRREVRSVR